ASRSAASAAGGANTHSRNEPSSWTVTKWPRTLRFPRKPRAGRMVACHPFRAAGTVRTAPKGSPHRARRGCARAWRRSLKFKSQSAILLVPLLIAWTLDISLTFSLQPPAYWSGDYSKVCEDTAVYRLLLVSHPLLFVAGSGAYIALCCL